MSDTRFPRYPGGRDPEPSQSERHADPGYGVSWVRVVAFLAVAVAIVRYLTLLTIRVMPMPVLI